MTSPSKTPLDMDSIVRKSYLLLIGICGGMGSSTAEVNKKEKFS
jgi:hypothetical protein